MDLVKSASDKLGKVAKQVFIEDGHIVINVCYEYNIPISDCNTPERIRSWVKQLSEKTWMTNKVMEQFIQIACDQSNVKL
ncbi:hypothetical protein FM037_03045 [Shewanella psychropiezotolerans]|uniref:Uncharacterized protein n=1 Tax=Shewanella psychropiezotolerans TaxID=2593655 RepID=A0ABX5WTH7_9GAMM|nr:hypothetical protein [Shewanella psychropiezotolerans]QDO82405.1 hypothetical protein FM037_03045 [Shewanella psychropiezotolerans]